MGSTNHYRPHPPCGKRGEREKIRESKREGKGGETGEEEQDDQHHHWRGGRGLGNNCYYYYLIYSMG